MPVVIAPWLETRPAEFAQAAEAGSRLSLEQRGQDIQANESQQRMQLAASEAANQAAMEQQKIAAAKEISRNRMALATQQAARKFQQQQAYQQAIGSGMDPIQAMMHFGPGMGQSMAGIGSLEIAQQRERMAALPPQFVPDPNDPKRTLGLTYGGQFHPAPQPRAVSTKAGAGAMARLKAAEAAVAAAAKAAAIGLPDKTKEAQEYLDKIAEEVDNPDSEEDGGDSESETNATPSAQFNYNPESGEFEPVGGK